MTPTDWRSLHDELTRCPWFARVGRPTERDAGSSVRRAASWAEADISWWCVNEASNVLGEFLHAHHNRQYQEWNRHIASFGPALDELMAGPVAAALAPEARTPGVAEWIRSQLTRAYLECVYSPLSQVRLVSDQVDWYLAGHFPCGWIVEEEPAFPDRAVAIVY